MVGYSDLQKGWPTKPLSVQKFLQVFSSAGVVWAIKTLDKELQRWEVTQIFSTAISPAHFSFFPGKCSCQKINPAKLSDFCY